MMKPTARILKFRGKELRTPADITQVHEALIADLVSGEITPADHRKIQREITERIKTFGSMLKVLDSWQKLNRGK
jgi:hypothetical protein